MQVYQHWSVCVAISHGRILVPLTAIQPEEDCAIEEPFMQNQGIKKYSHTASV